MATRDNYASDTMLVFLLLLSATDVVETKQTDYGNRIKFCSVFIAQPESNF